MLAQVTDVDQFVNRVPSILKTLQLIVDCHCGCKSKVNVLLGRAVHRNVIKPGHAYSLLGDIGVPSLLWYGQLVSKLDVVWLTVIYSNSGTGSTRNSSNNGYYKLFNAQSSCPVQDDIGRLVDAPVGTSFDLNKYKIKYCLN